jgi:hypothetical protein
MAVMMVMYNIGVKAMVVVRKGAMAQYNYLGNK